MESFLETFEKILKSHEIPFSFKKKVFNQCVLPALTYGCETWTSTTKLHQKLLVTQRALERSMLSILSKRDKKTND